MFMIIYRKNNIIMKLKNMKYQSIDRIKKYSLISNKLSCISDIKLSEIIENAAALHNGIGGESVLINIDNMPVFVKKIPLTDLERKPENVMSTANIFDLPLFFQYGIGSQGFGVWRELACNVISTNWVISGESENFPIMYHWRIFNTKNESDKKKEKIEEQVSFWEKSDKVRKRLEEINNASASVFLFMEYFPNINVEIWLGEQLKKEQKTAEHSILFVEKNINTINQFLKENGVLHFDTHFRNMVTDGEKIYLTDFGLALSDKFDLSESEKEFFRLHKNYDYYRAYIALEQAIISSFISSDDWKTKLSEYLKSGQGNLPELIAGTVKKYGSLTLKMLDFTYKLINESKLTPYPAKELDNLFNEIEL